ncbi:hypothetical protein P7C70_g7847, partial [Phenoliferia sp. Uapishka_3]
MTSPIAGPSGTSKSVPSAPAETFKGKAVEHKPEADANRDLNLENHDSLETPTRARSGLGDDPKYVALGTTAE